MPLSARASAFTRFGALLEMGLAAIPLVGPGQGLFAGQINPAMGATHHGRGALPVLPRASGGAGKAPPEPEGRGDNGYPEQRLFCLLVGNNHWSATQIGPEIVDYPGSGVRRCSVGRLGRRSVRSAATTRQLFALATCLPGC